MELFDVVSIIIVISAFFSYFNLKYLKLPNTIGLMLLTIIGSCLLILLKFLGLNINEHILIFSKSISFDKALLEWMLGFLLFSGSLGVNVDDLKEEKISITIFSTFSLVVSILIISSGLYYITDFLGIALSYIYCLLFATLVSPTDPIAVLGILKKLGVPKDLETNIVGESLFNDGVGVVIFIVLLGVLDGTTPFSLDSVSLLFFQEAIGGLFLGTALGFLTYKMIKKIENYQIEILLTLALVTGGYSLASLLHVSGPLAVIASGLLIGGHGRNYGMSEKSREHLDIFWEILDEILNAILFTLIGLEILVLSFSMDYLLLSILVIPLALLGRFFSIGLPVIILKKFRVFSDNTVKIMTWGGLRGGLAIALAISLPESKEKNLIIVMTYAIVVFSILFQGLTMKYLLKNK